VLVWQGSPFAAHRPVVRIAIAVTRRDPEPGRGARPDLPRLAPVAIVAVVAGVGGAGQRPVDGEQGVAEIVIFGADSGVCLAAASIARPVSERLPRAGCPQRRGLIAMGVLVGNMGASSLGEAPCPLSARAANLDNIALG